MMCSMEIHVLRALRLELVDHRDDERLTILDKSDVRHEPGG
jgi:hypothetical protein